MQKLVFIIASVLLGIAAFGQNSIDNIPQSMSRGANSPEPSKADIQFTSLQEVFEFADAKAIAIRSAITGEQISQAEQKEAKSYLLPYGSTSLGYNNNIELQPALLPSQIFNPDAPEGSFEELTFGTKYTYGWSLQAQWDVLDFAKIFAAQTSGIALKQSKANTELSKFNTYNSLATTYYSILLTREYIRIYEENLRVSEAISSHAREKYLKGILSEVELNMALIKNQQNEISLNKAKSNLNQFYLQLQSQLNINEPIEINDSPEDFALENTMKFTVHPEILWQEADVEKHESLFKQQKATRLPSISLYYQLNRTWATDNLMDFNDGYRLPQQVFGVNISLSLNGFSTRQKISQSKLQYNLRQEQLENTRLIKLKEDELLEQQIREDSQQLVQNKEILSLQKKNDLHAENKYQSGIMSLDERLDKYEDLLMAQNNYLESLAELTLTKYKIYIRQINFASMP